MRGRTVRTDKKALFLATLAKGLSVARASRESRLAYRTAYDLRKTDPAFALAWDEAIEVGTDLLEDEAIRRARDGVKKPIHYKGRRIATVQEYSDTLLIFSLKARRPAKFRDNLAVDVSGKLTLEQLVAQIPVVEKP